MGKHKLCPKISPKKTVEGFIGGVLTNGILFMLFGLIVSMYDTSANTRSRVAFLVWYAQFSAL